MFLSAQTLQHQRVGPLVRLTSLRQLNSGRIEGYKLINLIQLKMINLSHSLAAPRPVVELTAQH